MNYEDMSDNEINEQVADLIGGYAGNVHGSETRVKVKDAATNGMFYMEVDYCNNPSDAWPIMRDCLIGVSPDEDGVTCHFYGDWTASAFCSQLSYTHKNPLRAAMIVFLMMQEKAK